MRLRDSCKSEKQEDIYSSITQTIQQGLLSTEDQQIQGQRGVIGSHIPTRAEMDGVGLTFTVTSDNSAVNSKTQAYNYTASSGSFLDWVSSTFTTNGNYYVIYATTNWTGWAGSNTGICKVIRRNNDYYLEAYIADTATATNQSFYVNRYTGGSWIGWTKIPSRYEMDALTNAVGGGALNLPANSTVSYTISNNARMALFVLGADNDAMCIYIISTSSGGNVYRNKIGTASHLSETYATNTITITNSNAANLQIRPLIFAGTITAAS